MSERDWRTVCVLNSFVIIALGISVALLSVQAASLVASHGEIAARLKRDPAWEGYYRATVNVRYCQLTGNPDRLEGRWRYLAMRWMEVMSGQVPFSDDLHRELYDEQNAIEKLESTDTNWDLLRQAQKDVDAAFGYKTPEGR